MIAFPPNIEHLVDGIYPPSRQALAEQLAHIHRSLFFAGALLQAALPFGAFYGGVATRLRGELEARLGGRRLLVALAFAFVAVCALAVALFPLHWYAGFVLPHRFGLSRQPVVAWLRDWAVALGLSAAITALLWSLLVWAIGALPRLWPAVAALAMLPVAAFGVLVFPVFVAPLFNEYKPLPDSPLARSILALAHQHGIKADVIYTFDMSRQSTEGNAYVAGIGATERIAIGDNLLHDLEPDEVLYVVAHEMGHYKLGHLWIEVLVSWAGSVGAIALIATFGAALVRSSAHLARDLADPAALAPLAALLVVASLVVEPAGNALSRRIEHQADAFAAANTHLGDAGVRAFARLASLNLSPLHPPPLVVWYFYTHPPSDERIMFAARQAGLIQGPNAR